ncbi:hypothetical protein [Kineosporia succinea]|uniref:Outer membrane murein-binding lipoprotein Lpp n=1 Tax=Kineosporia succinea TaxID=84632 RepID=A0ABT9NXS2_9ACTN|nr:hypothetical protein [Kineosporia succinea]MDP9825219.1 outer membrane murein-binding lipoprotein Lpp [Kineosporia succinea]
MPENDAQTDTTSDTETGAVDLSAIQALLSENNWKPEQLASRLKDSRKWETRAKERADYDQLKAELDKVRQEGMSQAEKDLEAARSEGRATGEAEARALYGAQLVQAKFEGLLQGRGIEPDRAAVLAGDLNTAKYLGDDGKVNAEALVAFVDAVAPQQSTDARTGQQWAPTSFGAGQRTSTTAAPGAAGLAEIERRFGKKPA